MTRSTHGCEKLVPNDTPGIRNEQPRHSNQRRLARMRYITLLIAAMAATGASAQQARSVCSATATSLTPAGWHSQATAAASQPKPGLRLVEERPLPGPANRFDYQSIDGVTRRLYMNHMNAGRTVVFDLDGRRVVAEINDVPRAT